MADEGRGAAKKKRLGEILIEEKLISDLQLATALGDQKQWGGRLGTILLRMKFITEEDLAYALQQRLGVKWLSLRDLKIPETVVRAIPSEMAKHLTVFPVAIEGKNLILATTDPTDLSAADTVSFTTGMHIKTVLAVESDIKWAIAKYIDKTILDEPAKPSEPELKHAPKARPQAQELQRRVTLDSAFEALVKLLIEKNVITRDELARKISEQKPKL